MNEKLEKVCIRCEKTKDVDAFVTKRNCCLECHSEHARKWRKNNIELNRQIQSEYGKRRRVEAKLNKQK